MKRSEHFNVVVGKWLNVYSLSVNGRKYAISGVSPDNWIVMLRLLIAIPTRGCIVFVKMSIGFPVDSCIMQKAIRCVPFLMS